MKTINNLTPEVYLSTYDDNQTLYPVDAEFKGIKNVCVAVMFGDILIKISPKNTCKCSWDEAVKKHRDKLIKPAYWQMVGHVYHEVNQAIKMLGHEPIGDVWTDTEDNNPQYSSYIAWNYYGPRGYMNTIFKFSSSSVRATKVFKID